MALYMLGEFVISSVLSFHNKNLKRGTDPVSQLSFIWQAKENTSSRCEVGPMQKTQRKPEAQFFYMFFSAPPQPAQCKLGQARGMFISPEVPTLIIRPFLCSILVGFSFLCLLAISILASLILFYLPNMSYKFILHIILLE